MEKKLSIASLLLRIGLGITFLSAVAGRFGFWDESTGWHDFLEYTASVNSFVPKGMIPFLAVSATVLETMFAVLLIIGYKTRLVALGASILTLLFGLAMAYSFGLKSPLDYSVFVDCTAAFLLASIPRYELSLDDYINKKHQKALSSI